MEHSSSGQCGLGLQGVARAIDSMRWFGLLFIAVYAVAAANGQFEAVANGTDASFEGRPARRSRCGPASLSAITC